MAETTNKVVEVLLSTSASQHVETTNEAFEDVDRAIRGMLTKALDADGTTALTATEAQSRLIKLTGALTGAETVTIPDLGAISRPFTVWNASTGGYAITFKTVSGTGVSVPSGAIYELWIDASGNAQQTGGTSVGSAGDFIHVRDEKTSGTAGGTFTSGAWQTRVLNTEVADPGSHASLSSNQITIPAGTYEFEASAPGFKVDEHQLRLYNVTDAAVIILGQTANSDSGAGFHTYATVRGRFVIAGSKAIRLEHRCQTTQASDGFGNPQGWGTNVYAEIILHKVA